MPGHSGHRESAERVRLMMARWPGIREQKKEFYDPAPAPPRGFSKPEDFPGGDYGPVIPSPFDQTAPMRRAFPEEPGIDQGIFSSGAAGLLFEESREGLWLDMVPPSVGARETMQAFRPLIQQMPGRRGQDVRELAPPSDPMLQMQLMEMLRELLGLSGFRPTAGI